ncbi:hypothetical protein, partial [Trinickia mobilis]|uniref:hypothetical protein n=1 Tax=Trinickia mobilis TaxID=2816356 RepID=UPI001A8D697C
MTIGALLFSRHFHSTVAKWVEDLPPHPDEMGSALNENLPFDDFVQQTTPNSSAWTRVRENNAKHAMSRATPTPIAATHAPIGTTTTAAPADWINLRQWQKTERV